MNGTQIYTFDSSLRYTGTNNAPRFTIPNVGISADWCYISKISIPHTFYNITSSNNKLHWIDTASINITSTIPPGNYTIDELLSELSAQMTIDTTDGEVYTASRSQITHNVSISTSSLVSFTIRYVAGDHNLLKLLGFYEVELAEGQFYGDSNRIAALPAALVHTANNTYYSSIRNIYIKSDLSKQVSNFSSGTFGSAYDTSLSTFYTLQSKQDVIATLPVNTLYGSILEYSVENQPVKLYLKNATKITSLSFQLFYDEDFTPLDLNGRSWTIELVFGKN